MSSFFLMICIDMVSSNLLISSAILDPLDEPQLCDCTRSGCRMVQDYRDFRQWETIYG